MKKLCDDPSEVMGRSTVEEIVRWTSPVNYMRRHILEDVELHGVNLRAGEDLIMFYGSANRDEDVFEDSVPVRHHAAPEPTPRVWNR